MLDWRGGDAEPLPSTKFGLIRPFFFSFLQLLYQPPILFLFPLHEQLSHVNGLDKISNDKMPYV